MLYEFIAVNRDDIIRRCRAKVASRSVPLPTKVESITACQGFWISWGRHSDST